FYKEQISFTLDDNYCVQIHVHGDELTNDFMSGGQDVAVALAFIGAINKLNKAIKAGDEVDELDTPAYPLLLDAPVSNFGTKQIASFSNG
ncbi:MAG: hypothetical protein MJ238_05865, partial [Bacilli bacterium]|nr:hypothetical protein [Bacilli bacterium]